jgi:hypothetical protein
MEARSLDRRFSPSRLALLTRNRLLDEASIVGIGAAVVLALNLLGILLSHRAFFNVQRMSGGFWVPAIALAGLLLAAQAFKGMHDGKAGTEWILLPATPLEKYASAFIDLVILFPLAAALTGMALSALLGLVERAAGGPGIGAWAPSAAEALKAWADYAAAATLFLAGSASFRKAAFIKTAGLALAYGLALGLLVMLGQRALFGGGSAEVSLFSGTGRFLDFQGSGSSPSEGAQRALRLISYAASYAIFPAFAILFGAAKVAEKEGRDEVQ